MQFIKNLYQAIKIKFLKFQKSRELIKILPNDIKMLSNFFQLENKKLYLVGGCIRDIFLNKAPKDFDVCTDALPDEVIAILEKYNIKYNLQGEHFAVVVAKMADGDYEIATFRKDIHRNRNMESFIQYIKEKEPLNYENRVNLLLSLSNKQRI